MELNKNTIIISVVSLLLIFGFLYGAYLMTSKPATPVMYEDAKTVKATDHTKWSKEKKHVLVEYSDLQCPACKGFHDMAEGQIEGTDIPKNVTFVYRHFPLYQAHPYAEEAAYAAEAAGKQGKFFEMVDLLFDTQPQWSAGGKPTNFFLNLAKQLKLNEEQFKKDMTSDETKQKVSDDAMSGNNGGVNSTPTFFLNGEKVEVRDYNQFVQLLKNLK